MTFSGGHFKLDYSAEPFLMKRTRALQPVCLLRFTVSLMNRKDADAKVKQLLIGSEGR